jgi:hypothetical protein
MAILLEVDGGKAGIYPCECGEGGMVIKCYQNKGEPPTAFIVELSHEKEDGETSKHSVELTPLELSNVFADFAGVFYGSKN